MPCPNVELATETGRATDALPFNCPLAGLTCSQFAPSSVCDVADHEPEAPQLVSVTICAPGLARPWVAVYESDCGLVLRHAVACADRTMKVTLSVTFVRPFASVKVTMAL